MAQDGVQGAIWEALARLLAHCGGVWDPWGVIWGALVGHMASFEALGGAFSGPWERFGRPWWAIRAHLGSLGSAFWSLGGHFGGLGEPFGLMWGTSGVILVVFGATF